MAIAKPPGFRQRTERDLYPTLFPYTTLFRSSAVAARSGIPQSTSGCARSTSPYASKLSGRLRNRSEEHTSELQSRQYIVCRLLLEKKNTIPNSRIITSPATTSSTLDRKSTRL